MLITRWRISLQGADFLSLNFQRLVCSSMRKGTQVSRFSSGPTDSIPPHATPATKPRQERKPFGEYLRNAPSSNISNRESAASLGALRDQNPFVLKNPQSTPPQPQDMNKKYLKNPSHTKDASAVGPPPLEKTTIATTQGKSPKEIYEALFQSMNNVRKQNKEAKSPSLSQQRKDESAPNTAAVASNKEAKNPSHSQQRKDDSLLQTTLSGKTSAPSISAANQARAPSKISQDVYDVFLQDTLRKSGPQKPHKSSPADISSATEALNTALKDMKKQQIVAPTVTVPVSKQQNKGHQEKKPPQPAAPNKNPSSQSKQTPPPDTSVDMKKLQRDFLIFQRGNKLREASRKKRRRVLAGSTMVKEVTIPAEGLLPRDLASKLSWRVPDLLTKLEEIGEYDRSEGNEEEWLSKPIEADVVELLALDLGLGVKRLKDVNASSQSHLQEELRTVDEEQLRLRAPIVAIMGHVDHGKTTLLDALRTVRTAAVSKKAKGKDKKNDASDHIAGNEAGGITQKLSAFSVNVTSLLPESSRKPSKEVQVDSSESSIERIMFLDTPGHAAFSSMRGQGVRATDIVVLVIALDDGIQPQTLEAINTAKAGNCSIVVALNKIDKFPNLKERSEARKRIVAQLSQEDVLTEDFGGDVQVVEVAGRTGAGLADLVSSIAAQAEIMDLKANYAGFAEAIVLEAKQERGRGVVADVLIRWGSLKVGDAMVIGTTHGKVKALFNESGESIEEAFPAEVVRVVGLNELPSQGVELLTVKSEELAKEIVDRRIRVEQARNTPNKATETAAKPSPKAAPPAISPKLVLATEKLAVESTTAPVEEKKRPALGVGLKADSIGTLDALNKIVNEIAEKVKADVDVKLIHSSLGDLSAQDVDMCASGEKVDKLVLAFNVGVADNHTKMIAQNLQIPIHRENIIYSLEDILIEKVEAILPKTRIVSKQGFGTVLKTFKMKDGVIAGLQVKEGKMKKTSMPLAPGKKGKTTTASDGLSYFYRIIRNNEVVVEETVGEVSLKRFKEEVDEVDMGVECGLSIEGCTDFEAGDVVECYQLQLQAKKIPRLGHRGDGSDESEVKNASRESGDRDKKKKRKQ